MQIKHSVLSACRVRYLRCPVDQLPSVAELQLLVPSSGSPARGPQPAPVPAANLHNARDHLSSTVASRRAERTALWQDSTVFQDSFFAPDSRDGFSSSEFAPSRNPAPRRDPPPEHLPESESAHGVNEIGGVVVDTPPPRFSSTARR